MSTCDSSATGVAEVAGADAPDEGSASKHPRTTSMVATTRIKSTAPINRRSIPKSVGVADAERAKRAGSEARKEERADGRADGRSAPRDALDADAGGRTEARVEAAGTDGRGADERAARHADACLASVAR